MANFAKAQLMKYGWSEGKGLGKNENGITEALRPKLKFDTVGVGHKDTDSHQWWEVAFNKAASNIVIDSQSNGVAITSLKKDEDKKVKKLKGTSKYGNFMKTSTLCDGNLIQENSFDKVEAESNENEIIFPQLTDEELFKACGGRTAHKGARHGLTLNGKLERIAQQEQKLLGLSALGDIASTEKNKKSKSSKAQHRESQEDDYEMDTNANTILPSSLPIVTESSVRLSKSSRKKQKRRINDLSHQMNILCNMNEDEKEAEHDASDSGNTKRKKQLKRRRSKERKESTNSDSTKTTSVLEIANEICDIPLPPSEETEKKIAKKLKKKHTREFNEEELYDTSVKSQKKKKAKRKRSRSRQNTSDFTAEIDEQGPCAYKRSSNLELLVKDDDAEIPRVVSDETTDATLRPEKYDDTKLSDAHSENEPRGPMNMSRRNKKRLLKIQRRQQLKLDRITENLMAVHFDAEDTSGAAKPKQKMDAIMGNLTAVNIAENVTKSMKKSGK